MIRGLIILIGLLAAAGAAQAQQAPAPSHLARRDMVAAANPLAAAAGRMMLGRGGSAVDAAIAAQMVLNLVEPESSGIGGGAFLVLYSAKDRRVTTFDGRETAPQAARGDRFLDAQGKPLTYFQALVGGRSVGVPGVLRMLQLAHRRYGKLPWASLFQPAIKLARGGFPISDKLRNELARDRLFPRHGAARAYFYQPDGSARPAGAILTNPALAATFQTIAAKGAEAFYRGAIAADIVATADHAWVNPSALTLGDIAGLLDRGYLAARAKLIDPQHFAAGTVAPGEPPGLHADNWGRDRTPEFPSTSNLAVIDRAGDALAMTTTIEFAFGSHLMVRGFLLNNELTDFSFVAESNGKPVANRIQGGKRPRSSMAPTLVFDRHGRLAMSVGSAGGPAIITDVAKTLVATLDWNYPMQRAMDLPNIGNRNGATDIEATHAADALAATLTAEGHDVHRNSRDSGLSGIRVTPQGLDGAADDRRAGTALGD